MFRAPKYSKHSHRNAADRPLSFRTDSYIRHGWWPPSFSYYDWADTECMTFVANQTDRILCDTQCTYSLFRSNRFRPHKRATNILPPKQRPLLVLFDQSDMQRMPVERLVHGTCHADMVHIGHRRPIVVRTHIHHDTLDVTLLRPNVLSGQDRRDRTRMILRLVDRIHDRMDDIGHCPDQDIFRQGNALGIGIIIFT